MPHFFPIATMCLIFVLGYALIVMEHYLRLNKAAVALLSASLLWTLVFVGFGRDFTLSMGSLSHKVSEVSEIVFFLLGAMTIVELIDSHNGFILLSKMGKGLSKKKAAAALCFLTFFMSSVLDNLTTTLVMVALLKRLIKDKQERLTMGGLVVVSANAGGAWTPIGDVTTTMLWIKGNITTFQIVQSLFLPSLVAMLVALFMLTWKMEGSFTAPTQDGEDSERLAIGGRRVFILGVLTFLFVPLFKSITHVPAYIGILLGLSILWLITDMLHSSGKRPQLKVCHALTKIDSSSLLFFLGILLSIGALEESGILHSVSSSVDRHVGDPHIVATLIGLFSSVIDNVPLVAAAMSMYDVATYPVDCSFWQLLAYCAGTGGSILLIGSAAGIAFMGMESVSFFWYLRRISLSALISYFAGLAVYILLI